MDLPAAGQAGNGLDMIDAEHAALNGNILPDPTKLPPVMASTDCTSNWLVASFGCDTRDGRDWHLVTVNIRGSDTVGLTLMNGARDDAVVIAAIVNAYRLGKLVPSTTTVAVKET